MLLPFPRLSVLVLSSLRAIDAHDFEAPPFYRPRYRHSSFEYAFSTASATSNFSSIRQPLYWASVAITYQHQALVSRYHNDMT